MLVPCGTLYHAYSSYYQAFTSLHSFYQGKRTALPRLYQGSTNFTMVPRTLAFLPCCTMVQAGSGLVTGKRRQLAKGHWS